MKPALATRFHALHADGLLRLANAWDGGSARLAQAAGARAIATSSAAVAWAHGWPDGDLLPVELLLQTTRAVAGATELPVTIDIEGGYSDDPARVGLLVTQLLQAGAVGINIEDGSKDPALLCDKIAAARAVATSAGVDLFINARIDTWLRGLAPPAQRASETLARAARYRAAGANGLFAPGVTDEGEIAALVAGTDMPVNVLAWTGLPDAGRLQALGVRRLSAGSAISEAMHGHVLAMMREFVATGRVDTGGVPAATYGDVQAMMARR
ncbi:MAG TPA: isocitrate lyase/phosphoenolpyruvate mutase family protein [Burkholderiaceae bacterium]